MGYVVKHMKILKALWSRLQPILLVLSIVVVISSGLPGLIPTNQSDTGSDEGFATSSATGEWQDDFTSSDKMTDRTGINVTGGKVEINFARKTYTGSMDDYRPFPPVGFDRTGGYQGFNDFFYPNSGRTGYQTVRTEPCDITHNMATGDLDLDGDFDLICANWAVDDEHVDSQIWWADSNGRWSSSRTTELKVQRAKGVATGDFNGDGWPDIVFSCHAQMFTVDSVVFLNKGNGAFNYKPDVYLSQEDSFEVDTGDLNGDGYDDIVLAVDYTSLCYFGGPNGPDNTTDIRLPTGQNCYDVLVDDINGDWNPDVVFATGRNQKSQVYLGSPFGPDTIADYQLTTGNYVYAVAANDFNEDGHTDLVFTPANTTMMVFKGSRSGWSDSDVIGIDLPRNAYAIEVGDIDKDGRKDLGMGIEQEFRIYFGDGEWPSTPDRTYDAMPKLKARNYVGTFTTEAITLPAGMRWDALVLEGSLPNGTDAAYSVLDSNMNEIPGYKGITDLALDLMGFTYDTFHIRVHLTTERPGRTPSLEALTVKWIDQRMWRDQFYTKTRFERLRGLGVEGGYLSVTELGGSGPQLVYSSLRGDYGYTTWSPAFFDAGGLDYLSRAPEVFATTGAMAVSGNDINEDGYLDLFFASHMIPGIGYEVNSPLFRGSSVGWRSSYDELFPTVGAHDVALEDINSDGYLDVVFAQQRNGMDFTINSTLFWGKAVGWNSTPDVAFQTSGASDVEVVDIDGDSHLDLVFACYMNDTSADVDSLVFLQESTGFCGTVPSYRLPTKGAVAVAAGDLDGDWSMDLVFANYFSEGPAEEDSYIYWGEDGGGFNASPTHIPTRGASDVEVADVNLDTSLDLVFANNHNVSWSYDVESYVYLNGGSGNFSEAPDARLPTEGAMAVSVADLDGKGWMDLVFACFYNGSTHHLPSPIFLGTSSGWSTSPDIQVPTEGATDVLVDHVLPPNSAGYMSQIIIPWEPLECGVYHTLSCTAVIDEPVNGRLMIVDGVTWDVLMEFPFQNGSNVWELDKSIQVRSNPSVRIVAAVENLSHDGGFELDDLWLNWTPRFRTPPRVLGLNVSRSELYRTQSITFEVEVADDYDRASDLGVMVEHRLNGTDQWHSFLIGTLRYEGGLWLGTIKTVKDTPIGVYDFRVSVTDSDGMKSMDAEFSGILQVLNNLPDAAEVDIRPENPTTIMNLRVNIVREARDIETRRLMYSYVWYVNDELADVYGDTVIASHTSRGENWTVEVKAYDGDDWGPSAWAWKVILNSPPLPNDPLSDLEMYEDTVDTSLNLTTAFLDPDEDPLSWDVDPPSPHLDVVIDQATGAVTVRPVQDWNGEVSLTFVASDGELLATQTIEVTVRPVNDPPRIVTVDGDPPPGAWVTFVTKQGEELVVEIGAMDPDGDAILYSSNSTLVDVDPETGQFRLLLGNDLVGTTHVTIEVTDGDASDFLYVIIEVGNINDPLGDPRIVEPEDTASFVVNESFRLLGACDDPDIIHGQVLNFSWASNVSGHLGYGPDLSVRLLEPGEHVITLTVRDPDFSKTASIRVFVKAEPTVPPQPDDDDREFLVSTGILILIALIALGVTAFVIWTYRKSDQ
jgi:hypothetical protein